MQRPEEIMAAESPAAEFAPRPMSASEMSFVNQHRPAMEAAERRQLHADIELRFTFHPVTGDAQRRAYENVRARAREFAHWLADNAPPSRELSLALTRLDEAVMHANAAIARRS